MPTDLDYVDVPAYRYLLRSMFKYRSLRNLVPHLEWLHYPITLLLSARGCTENCAVCGGSRSAYRAHLRARAAGVSVAGEAGGGRRDDRHVFASADLHGPRSAHGRIAGRRALPVLLEAHAAGQRDGVRALLSGERRLLRCVARSVPTWSIEITLESPDEALRQRNGKFPWPNAIVEDTIERALAHGCHKLDIFFMTGLPGQRYEDALKIADYCEHLLDRFGSSGRLHPFVAPLGPFLDPGSRAFEEPGFGYTSFCRTLEEHRQAFLHDGWHKILSYETNGMTRDEIVRATYDVAERLND